MRQPRRTDPRTGKILEKWVRWKVKEFLRKHAYGTLSQISMYVYGYHSYNCVVVKIMDEWAKQGTVARVGYGSGKRYHKSYCLKEREQEVRRQFIPRNKTVYEILTMLNEGPKCASVIREDLTHPYMLEEQMALLQKKRVVTRVQMGAKRIYGLAEDREELVEMRRRHQRERHERIMGDILAFARRYPESSTSTIQRNVCHSRVYLHDALRALVLRGDLVVVRRRKKQYRYRLAKPKRCMTCGQALRE